MQSACFVKVVPTLPCFTAPCLTHSSLHASRHGFLHLHLASAVPSLLNSLMSRSTATLQGGFCFGRLADPLLTGCEPQSLIEVTLDASEVCDATDVGRWTSLLFSGARRKCYSFRGLLFRHTQSWTNPGEMLSSFQDSGNWSKGERNRDLESVQDSQMER